MLKKIVIFFILLAAISVSAQEKTEILNAQAKTMLLGRHKLSLQWISWDYFGSATVAEKNGMLLLKGEQQGRGKSTGDYVTVDGMITSVDAKEFKFKGTIITRVSYINGGNPCTREDELTFKITGTRKYWRMQEMNNPCDEAADYVDIYFR